MKIDKDLLRNICIGFTVLFFINLLFIVHNIVRYVYGLGMRQNLVVMFYIMISLTTVSRIVEFTFRAIDPENSFPPNVDVRIIFAEDFAATFSVCVEIVLTLTMLKLCLALKLINGSIDLEQVKKWECLSIILVVAYIIDYIAFDIVFLSETFTGESWVDWIDYWIIANFLVLTLMYTLVATVLQCAMRRLVGNFQKEIRSINC